MVWHPLAAGWNQQIRNKVSVFYRARSNNYVIRSMLALAVLHVLSM